MARAPRAPPRAQPRWSTSSARSDGNFQRIHVDGARNAATAAARAGARSFVQVSAIGADAGAEAAYARSKGEGEAAARRAFPGATIVRPSIVFGTEDQFVNRFAQLIGRLPVVPVIRPSVLFQPVWVGDVARAIAQAALVPGRYAGGTFELGGPERISMLELQRFIAGAIGRRPRLLPMPDAAAAALARFGGWLPGAPITWDQWLMLGRDNVVAPDAQGFAAFDIAPHPLAAIALRYLVRFRREGRFSLGTAT